MKRILVILFLLPCILLCNAQSKNVSRRKAKNVTKEVAQPVNVVTLEDVTQKVEELIDANFDVVHPASTFDSSRVVVTSYTTTQDTILVQKLQDCYYEAFFNASENEQLDSAIICAFKYLIVDGRKDENVIWQVLIDNYGCDGDTENTKFLIDGFRKVSEQRDDEYAEIVNSLSTKYDDVIHPVPFDEVVSGYWISLDNKFETTRFMGMEVPIENVPRGTIKNLPDYILRINDVFSDGGTMMLSSPKTPWNAKKSSQCWFYSPSYNNYMLRTSQATFCDANAKELSLTFASEKIKEGNTDYARKEIAENRQWQANMHGKINSSNMNFGNRLAAGVITDITTGLFDGLAMNSAAGSVTSEAYWMTTKSISPKLMDANITYKRVKVSSLGYKTTQEYQPNIPNRFVKWEDSDSVIFISSKGKPIFVGSLSKDSPLLNDYYKVRKKHNFWRPQYLLPTVASVGIGTFMMVKGLSKAFSADYKMYSKKENNSRIIKGVILFIAGDLVATAGIAIVSNVISMKRHKVYREINQKSMDKMREKATHFSLRPSLDPIENSAEMDLTIDF